MYHCHHQSPCYGAGTFKPAELMEGDGSYKVKNLEAGTLVVGKMNLMRKVCLATIRTQIIRSCARRSASSLLVWPGLFFRFCFCLGGADFRCDFHPFLRRKLGLHSTWSDYLSSYCTDIREWARLILGNKDEPRGMGGIFL